MAPVHLVVGCAVILLNLVAGAVGGIAWYRDRPSIPFWYLLRAAQASVLLQVMLGGLLVFTGHKPADNLHYLYGILPLVVSLLAEGARTGAAQRELGDVDFESPPRRNPAIPGPRHSPSRDGHHGRKLRSDLLPSPTRRQHQRALLKHAGRYSERLVVAAVEDERVAFVVSRAVTSPVTITWSPPAITSRRSQATQTRASSIAGTPSRSLQATPSHFSATGALVAKDAGDRLLAGVQDADPEAVRRLDREQGARAAVEAGEHQHRLDRERADRVGGRAGRAVGAGGGDDGDAGRQQRHRGAEAGWVGGCVIGGPGSHRTSMMRAACAPL